MRGSQSNRFRENVNLKDRIISAFSYLTFGMVGFIWIVFSYIKGERLTGFIKFNCYQSIVIGLLVYLVRLAVNIFLGFISLIPFIGGKFINLFQLQIFAFFSLTQLVVLVIVAYPAILAILGKYPNIPGLSHHIKQI